MLPEDEDPRGLPSDNPNDEDLQASLSTATNEPPMIAAVGTLTTPSEPSGLDTEANASSSFPVDDGSLMHLYESRLRRLRDYESQVYSRYSNTHSINPAPGQRLVQFYNEQQQQQQQQVEIPEQVQLQSSGNMPPAIITMDYNCDVDPLDDITLSTGINSNVETSSAKEIAFSSRHPNVVSAEVNHFVADPPVAEEEKSDEDISQLGDANWAVGTAYSTESSLGKDLKKEGGGDAKGDTQQGEEVNEGYTYLASMDSKYETYQVLVDPEQDDRAVEIALYSAGRPHMRGFHYAWLAFFIAFFTWFAITPLLSEVAAALNLSRKEIWTSSTLAVAGSAVTRILIGPMNDIYGPRWTMSSTLLFSAIPTAIAGVAIQNAASLYVIRLLIGVAGSAFVTCQFWTTTLFTAEVAGTANSLAAGWGNLGGGVAQLVMGSLLFPLFKVIYGGEGYGNANKVIVDDNGEGDYEYDRAADLAWRTILVFPALLCLYMAFVCIRYGDDSPKGNFRQRKAQGLMPVESAKDAIRRGACNLNTWLLFVHYGCCFGVEITMTNAAALYFQEEFGQNTESAAAIASVFGWMNLFARGIGGFSSDMACATHGMRGRLWVQACLLVVEGGLVCVFSTTETLATAILVMVMFSIFVQAAEGSTFAIVPYVDYAVTGSIAGVVGAGGNVGGVIFSLFFREFDNRTAFLLMGCLVLASSLITALLAVPGHRSLIRGVDAAEVRDRRDTHAEQLGNVPNVDVHLHNNDGTPTRRSVLRTDLSSRLDASDMPGVTEDPSTVSEDV